MQSKGCQSLCIGRQELRIRHFHKVLDEYIDGPGGKPSGAVKVVDAREGRAMQLTPERLRNAYRLMKTIREFEERLHVEIATGEIPGFTHLYAGQEAVAVGVCEPLSDSDYIAGTHRGPGTCIAWVCELVGV